MSTAVEATKPQSTSTTPFDYHPSLQGYMVSCEEFLHQHPQYHLVCTGIVVFNPDGKLLLVQRAADEKAFPDLWEIPGGKVDEPDETILHAAVRELKEETGLEAAKIVRKVGEFGWTEVSKSTGKETTWRKLIFEIEVKDTSTIVLDPVEHQSYVWASEDEVLKDSVGDVSLNYITPPNKVIKLDAFRLRREGLTS